MIDVRDIITHAACNAGIIPSFNLDNLPADLEQMSRTILETEILPAINCDRTLDVSIIAEWYQPRNNEIYLTTGDSTATKTHIDFFPMRIEAVMDDTARQQLEYVYRSEFENIDYRWNVWTYTIEEQIDGIKLLFRNNKRKKLVIPVPLRIKDNELIAQPKFRAYVIDVLAVRLATAYQVSTLPAMQTMAVASLNLLKKNITNPIRPINRRVQIRNILRSGEARYWHFMGNV